MLAVSFSPPERVAAYLDRHPLPFPAVADPTRQAYRLFELGRTSWRAMLGLRVVGRYLRLIFGGWVPDKAEKDDDLLQLGGDFVLDAQGRLVYAYRSSDPTDRPQARDLMQAVRRALGIQ